MGSHSAEAAARLLYSSREDLKLKEYILTPKEVARILERSPHEVIELARAGRLRAKRMGSRWRFRNLDVVAYVAEWAETDKTP